MTKFTTIKEYDAAVRASQRRIKQLTELEPLQDPTALELAKASHKFLLASRAKFKETGVSAPKLRDVQALALEEGLKRHMAGDPGVGDTHVSELAQGVDPGAEPPVIFEGFDNHHGITRVHRESERTVTGRTPSSPNIQDFNRRLEMAAEGSGLTRDRSRDFVPQARIIRERSHAGAMREPKYAADDCRSAGLGYKRVHRKGEAWRRTVALAVRPVYPSMRDSTAFLNRGHGARITVNGQAW
jgi:hypothetical protein